MIQSLDKKKGCRSGSNPFHFFAYDRSIQASDRLNGSKMSKCNGRARIIILLAIYIFNINPCK